jgi:hypothetical protein
VVQDLSKNTRDVPKALAPLQSHTRYYLLTDHLGSTSITANSSGTLYGEKRYMLLRFAQDRLWGEERYTSGTLPAGLEIVNPALDVSGSIPQDPGSPDYKYGWWWWGPWYEHQNMRDERAEAFTPLLWEGVYEYTYIARATTPGTFVVPPAKAEEMYSPEVFGRSGSDWVIVD